MHFLLAFLLQGVVLTGHASAFGSSATSAHSKLVLAEFVVEYMEVRYQGVDLSQYILYVSLRSQRLFHTHDRRLNGEHVISTTAKGLGEVQDSQRAPTGLQRCKNASARDRHSSAFRRNVYTRVSRRFRAATGPRTAPRCASFGPVALNPART